MLHTNNRTEWRRCGEKCGGGDGGWTRKWNGSRSRLEIVNTHGTNSTNNLEVCTLCCRNSINFVWNYWRFSWVRANTEWAIDLSHKSQSGIYSLVVISSVFSWFFLQSANKNGCTKIPTIFIRFRSFYTANWMITSSMYKVIVFAIYSREMRDSRPTLYIERFRITGRAILKIEMKIGSSSRLRCSVNGA